MRPGLRRPRTRRSCRYGRYRPSAQLARPARLGRLGRRICQPGQMPGARTDPSGAATARPLWLTALWSGIAPVVVGAVVSIVAVAICWLPASGASGNANSAIRGGLLTFLAALHGGITVDGVPTSFLPLGLLLLVGAVSWRAG